MFSKILIANRGEIACRIMKTARRLGVATVAVYSDVDRNALHVAMADEAVHIGGPAPSDSYLKGDAIIKVALATGAQAIHPGYGFLSENPDFVDRVVAAGLVFIGPSARAARVMGLKGAAKSVMQESGVPIVPGYHGANQDPLNLQAEAERIGYPVLIKAVAGGGGKGMRMVGMPADFFAALSSAQSEAVSAFGNPDVLIEKYVETPRHIEFQIFGDGNRAVHLFERDCSLQRRHQKVIEEAPAPGMTEDMRAAMGAAAVRAAESIGYAGAGTVEFIVDASDGLSTDRFWFMEMNTRLQVEHPVTEAITGVDLVEWQLRVAAGEGLPKRQDQLAINGHAFEARLYAEDVPSGFLPATGTLTHLKYATECRADSGVRAGDTISPFYDPMIGKIIVHGATRDIALSQLRSAISRTEVAGTVTNLSFLGKLAWDKDFSAGDVDTGLIDRKSNQLCASEIAPAKIKAAAVLLAADLSDDDIGFALWGPLARRIDLVDAEPFSAVLRVLDRDSVTVEIDDETFELSRKSGVSGIRIGHTVSIFADQTWHFDIPDPLALTSSETADNLVRAPMPGLVKAVFVVANETVRAGDRLAILEAMKMEHTLVAAVSGTVAEAPFAAGTQVEAGAVLVRFQEEPE